MVRARRLKFEFDRQFKDEQAVPNAESPRSDVGGLSRELSRVNQGALGADTTWPAILVHVRDLDALLTAAEAAERSRRRDAMPHDDDCEYRHTGEWFDCDCDPTPLDAALARLDFSKSLDMED